MKGGGGGSYVISQVITTDYRFVRVSYVRNQVITIDSRSESVTTETR